MFKIGQKVVCIDDSKGKLTNIKWLEKDKDYQIYDLRIANNGRLDISVVGIMGFWDYSRFRPLDEAFTHETIAMLNEHFESLTVTV